MAGEEEAAEGAAGAEAQRGPGGGTVEWGCPMALARLLLFIYCWSQKEGGEGGGQGVSVTHYVGMRLRLH